MLFGNITSKFTGFVQEVTPHEVAHQWWGHMVGWASFHDQWLSEGFAEFSAGLFFQASKPPGAGQFLQRLRGKMTVKKQNSQTANQARPILTRPRVPYSLEPPPANP